jgi:PhzF family phenazine biosynthesis protein
MSSFNLYQIDAFTDQLFAGNPAAVIVLDDWLDDGLMQNIAMENNLAETAFVRGGNGVYDLRWFTPTHEVAFCGHATLATAHVLFSQFEENKEITFRTNQVGELRVTPVSEGRYQMDFPTFAPEDFPEPPDLLLELFPDQQSTLFRNFENYFVELGSEDEIHNYIPDLDKIRQFGETGLVITAKSDAEKDYDFLSRYFVPGAGIPEDPVTGSTHSTLVPYWSKRLGKRGLHAFQASQRGGHLFCELQDDRLLIEGSAVTFFKAEISLPG